jgi:capsular polysaccharide biosynthesis protein
MIDILPRLDLVRAELEQGLPVIAPPDLRKPQRTALRAVLDGMGYDRIEIIEPPHHVCTVGRLVMPTQMAHPLDMSPRQVALLRETFLTDDADTDLPKRLYISRADAAIRRVKNEDELLSRLEPLGFVSVQLAELTVAEQVSLFRQAECIIGHHGAGFANLAFCSPGTAFIEIFQYGHFSHSFARLAQLGYLRYGYCVGAAEGVDTIVSLSAIDDLCEQFAIQ